MAGAERRRRGVVAGTLLLVAALGLGGCASERSDSGDGSGGGGGTESVVPDVGAPAPRVDTSGQVEVGGQADRAGAATGSQEDAAQRDVIRTADLQVRVADVDDAADAATRAVTAAGGSLTEELHTTADPAAGTGERADLSYRVPPAALDATLTTLGGLGTVESRQQQAQDVTAEVTDLDVRIASLEASVRRLQQLLARAESVADVAAVEAELSRREAELESLRAQRRGLGEQVAMATVGLHLYDETAAGDAPPAGFWEGLRAGWAGLVGALGWLATALGAALPFLLVLGVPLVGVGLLLRRRAARRRGVTRGPTPPAPAPPAA